MQKFGDEQLGRSAGRIWSEGRANPVDWEIRTALGIFTTEDRSTWRTSAGEWTAELRRSRNGNHWFLAVFERGVYCGRYDASGWHTATDRCRWGRRPRPSTSIRLFWLAPATR